jgi:hypothetical protein
LTSSDPAVHGFMAHDGTLRAYQLLLWNFSTSPARVTVSLAGVPQELRMRHIILDAVAPSADENARLRFEAMTSLGKGDRQIATQLEPYAVESWYFE